MFDYRKTYNSRYEKGNRFHLDNRKETIVFMLIQKKSYFLKIVAIVLTLALMMPVNATAATPETVMPMASDYLAAYNAYICAMGDGELQLWFSVTGTGTQEYLGALSIWLYESTDNVNWEWVESFMHTDYGHMLARNEWQHITYVPYHDAVPGRYYKAYVGIWGGPADTGDSRYFWTPVEIAT